MIVAIPGWSTGPNSFGITLGYNMFIREELGVTDIRILQPESPILTDIDLLLLPGGSDINPLRYGAVPNFYTDKPDLIKEYFDEYVLPKYIKANIPIFGICRGLQAICVHYGCMLYQNMYHETNDQKDPYEWVHEIKILERPSMKVRVNSRHHQSVYIPEGNKDVIVLATHEKRSDHIEAVYIKDKPICGVQWHPEDLSSNAGVQYAISLIKTICKK